MELLLLLTALLASLTGTGSADRQLRGVQGVAVVQVAQDTQAAVKPACVSLPMAVAQPLRAERVRLPLARTAPLACRHFPFERRLE
ncbi:MAG: hypothetical protein KF730_10245 [Sphingomonas sp.]|uniref:hypothetical protein n=1 Tax=Sphingomonas sp. TaxID=28214 RepID=UPI0025CFD54D|nr:hypothetical protein [Sphingomonas sp.]MBX3564942.1 hypothetical protein [Sphingomonas sp.]